MPLNPVPPSDASLVNSATAQAAAPRRHRRHWQANKRLTTVLLLAWLLVTFLVPYNARALSFEFFGWPFSFWVAAQGSLLLFWLLVMVYSHAMCRQDDLESHGERD